MSKEERSKKAWKYNKKKTPPWRDNEFRLRVVPHKHKDRTINKQEVKRLLYTHEDEE